MAEKERKKLVIVESPTKAKKISGYLGKQYKVLASMGHIRDLPAKADEIPKEFKSESWSDLAVNVDQDFDPLYVIPKEKKKVVKELKDALKEADELILATDEDREGESIGWHLAQLLQPKVPVSRIVFSEITRDAIQKAILHPRQLDENLVSAQETRRVVDRLYGYSLSPLLWKKVDRNLSAGRVQSVAVRLLVQREIERLNFKTGTYWDLKAQLSTPKNQTFFAMLAALKGKRIASGKDFDENTGKLKADADVVLLGEKEAQELKTRLLKANWEVTDIEERPERRSPAAPFITSTLQKEANRKLNLSARRTMSEAQKLYEAGYITYMRTDSTTLSSEAIQAARGTVTKRYGKDYLSPQPRQYQTKSKNAQEAHEAIRPAGTEMKTGEELGLTGIGLQIYNLIWKRTVATQMANAELRFQTVKIMAEDAEFRATGRQVTFPGFFRVYVEGSDDPEAALEDQESPLPSMQVKDKLGCKDLEALAHETKPPARYTEATLVGALEDKGIGRPSTYANIVGTIQDRGYVRQEKKQLIPTFTAMVVTKFLEEHFPNLVDTEFTANMEQTLDDIANGEANRLNYLRKFYSGEAGLGEQVKTKESSIERREARTLKLASIEPSIRLGRHGFYLEKEENGEQITASLPPDIAPADLTGEMVSELIKQKKEGPKILGTHPEQDEPIFLLNGRFGWYLQMGEQIEDGARPKTMGIPKTMDPEQVTLEQAVQLLSLPRHLGKHPETGKVVTASIGPYGPYILHDKKYGNFDSKTHTYTAENGRSYNILNVDLATAVEILSKTKKKEPAKPLKELGDHPEDGKPVVVLEGKYGPYIKHNKINATVPKDMDIAQLTLQDAIPLLEERAAKGGKGKKKSAKKASAKKAAPKKSATKKAPAKKKAAKKKKKDSEE